MITNLLRLYSSRFSRYRKFILMLLDVAAVFAAFACAMISRLELPLPDLSQYWALLLSTAAITIYLFERAGLYRSLIRYIGQRTLLYVSVSGVVSTLMLISLSYYFQVFMPRTVPVLYSIYLLLIVTGGRYAYRIFHEKREQKSKQQVIIYGAGSSGKHLLSLIKQNKEMHVVAFIDDDNKKHRQIIRGLTIYNPQQIPKLLQRYHVDRFLLAMPSTALSRKARVFASLMQYGVKVQTVPDLTRILSGIASIADIQDIDFHDLLERSPVSPLHDLMLNHVQGKSVMVTGAGGSIGSEICRQILKLSPKQIVLFEHSEANLYHIEQNLKTDRQDIKIIPILGTVLDKQHLTSIMRQFDVETIYHAAAYKHVPLVELNIIEGVKNNVLGTYYTAQAALQTGVGAFILISTDKAVRPTNIMGTSKRLAEIGLQALAKDQKTTCFSMVRFGNVLGSSGSVVPLFKSQISKGGPVTVTHPDVTRYFMTIPEAAQLVIQAGGMAEGGEVFVLDMGQPIKISDLAKNLITLSGQCIKTSKQARGIEIHYTGLRPGEKLYEELLVDSDAEPTDHPKILKAHEPYIPRIQYETVITQLEQALAQRDISGVKRLLLSTPTGYAPTTQ